MNSLTLILAVQRPVHALSQFFRAQAIHFSLRWCGSVNGHVVKMLRQQIEPLKTRFNIGIASFCAHKVVNGPNVQRSDTRQVRKENQ